MSLARLLETWGNANVLAAGGIIIGLAFGFAAQLTRFFARAAVLECYEGQAGERLSVWLLAFGACLLGVQVLVAMGWGFTQAIAVTSFEAVTVRSLSFSGPSAE